MAASRAASTARISAEQVALAEHRALLREVVSTIQNVLLEASRIESIASQLKIEYDTLAAFSGGFGGSTHSGLQETLNGKLALAIPLKTNAQEIGRDYAKLRIASIEDLSQSLTKVDNNLASLRTLRDELNATLAGTAQQVQLYRAKRVA